MCNIQIAQCTLSFVAWMQEWRRRRTSIDFPVHLCLSIANCCSSSSRNCTILFYSFQSHQITPNWERKPFSRWLMFRYRFIIWIYFDDENRYLGFVFFFSLSKIYNSNNLCVFFFFLSLSLSGKRSETTKFSVLSKQSSWKPCKLWQKRETIYIFFAFPIQIKKTTEKGYAKPKPPL